MEEKTYNNLIWTFLFGMFIIIVIAYIGFDFINNYESYVTSKSPKSLIPIGIIVLSVIINIVLIWKR